MMMVGAMGSNNLYKDILDITSNYLGPAAQRFVDRQIANHLNKTPEQVTRKDIGQLVEWSRAALALLTDDKKTIDEFEKNMLRLAHEK